MRIPTKQLEAFKILWRKHYHEELTDEEAYEYASQLLRLIQIIYKRNQFDLHHDEVIGSSHM